MSDNTNENRLPPPAFPPGTRKHVHRNSDAPSSVAPSVESVEDAFISPDDPMPPRTDPVADAFISPDDPIPERTIELAEPFATDSPLAAGAEGEVVGMDFDAHTAPAEVTLAADPHVTELVGAIARLSDVLQRRGEAGLRTLPEMSRFEATLRSYCVGYLAGRRAEEPPEPELEEALPSDF